MTRTTKYYNYLIIFSGVSFFMFCFFISSFKTDASSPGFKSSVPFGGTIVKKTTCSCSSGFALVIKGSKKDLKSSGTYLYNNVKPYKNGQVDVRKDLIGDYTPGGKCLVAGDPCTTIPITKGTIKSVGTN